MRAAKPLSLNSAVDTATMGAWLQAALQAATKRIYKVKNDAKNVYIQIDGKTQIVVTPKDATTGTFSKQTKSGSVINAEPGVTYKNAADCVKQMTAAITKKTTASRKPQSVDDQLFLTASSLRRTFSNPKGVPGKVVGLNSDISVTGDSFPTIPEDTDTEPTSIVEPAPAVSPEPAPTPLSTLKDRLTEMRAEFIEFPALLFSSPSGGETSSRVILVFHDPDEGCFVSTDLDATNPGNISYSADEVIEKSIGNYEEGSEPDLLPAKIPTEEYEELPEFEDKGGDEPW